MVQYIQFAQVFMVWIGRWSLEFDIMVLKPGLFLLDCFIQIKS